MGSLPHLGREQDAAAAGAAPSPSGRSPIEGFLNRDLPRNNLPAFLGLFALAALLAVPAFAQAQGSVTEIATGDNFFAPEEIASDAGESML